MGKNKMKKGAVLAVVVFALTFIMILTTFILQLVATGAKRAVKTISIVNKNVLCEYVGTQFKTNNVDLTTYKKFFNSEYHIVIESGNELDSEVMVVKKSEDSEGFIYKIEINVDVLKVKYETDDNVILYVDRDQKIWSDTVPSP